jgi:hypothetical protein
LGKGLNRAVFLVVLPIEDILTSVEKAVFSLPEEAAEEVWQEIFRILKASSKPRYNHSGAKIRAVWTLHTNTNLMVPLQARAMCWWSSAPTTTISRPFEGPYLQETAQGFHRVCRMEDHLSSQEDVTFRLGHPTTTTGFEDC